MKGDQRRRGRSSVSRSTPPPTQDLNSAEWSRDSGATPSKADPNHADDWLERFQGRLQLLTERQRQAVEHVNGPMLVLAGPGSGKTRVMSHRIAYLVAQGVPAWQIVALTFTNKAAQELTSRIQTLVPGADVWAGTFHRFCGRLLRRYANLVGLDDSYTILDRDDQRRLLKEATQLAGVELFHYSEEQIASVIGQVKSRSIDPQRTLQELGDPLSLLAARIYPIYARRMLECNAVDFDDMLIHVARLLTDQEELRRLLDDRIRYLLVDEYQDTNSVQYAIVRALSIDHPNLVVTGDPDQSIYGWRGADIGNIIEFERDFPQARVVPLEENFRSTKRILAVADQLIQNNQRRRHKELITNNAEGTPVRLTHYPDHRDEAEQIAEQIKQKLSSGERCARDFAIFYRVNSLSRSFEMALRKRSIPYQVVQGFEFFERREVKDVLSYLTLLVNPRNDVAFERVVNAPARGIGKTTVDKLKRYAAERRIPLLDAARQASSIPGLSSRSGKLVVRFAELIDKLALRVHESVEEILGLVLTETGLRESLESRDLAEGEDRIANIDELLNAAREFDDSFIDREGQSALEAFLEQSVLAADTDAYQAETDRVTLMTLHAAKGLEFPCVYIVAIEHNLLPHSRAKSDESQLEEERRLLFVGITRAREELNLSRAHYRTVRGSVSPTSPSEFLLELPRETMEVLDLGVDSQFRLRGFAGKASSAEEFHGAFEEASDFAGGGSWDAYDGIDELPEEWNRSVSDKSLAQDDERVIEFDPIDFDVDEGEPHDSPAKRGKPGRVQPQIRSQEAPKLMASKLQTAAQMAGESSSKTGVDPEAFRFKQLVLHPEYGTGTIVALSGAGMKRVATVKFVSHGEKTFRLAFSPLTPIG